MEAGSRSQVLIPPAESTGKDVPNAVHNTPVDTQEIPQPEVQVHPHWDPGGSPVVTISTWEVDVQAVLHRVGESAVAEFGCGVEPFAVVFS